MSMVNCNICHHHICTDGDNGQWDIKDKDGWHYGYVCEDCVTDNEDFELSQECNALTAVGYLLRLAAAMAVIIILGADLEPLLDWVLL